MCASRSHFVPGVPKLATHSKMQNQNQNQNQTEHTPLLPLRPKRNGRNGRRSNHVSDINKATRTSHDHWPRHYRRRLTPDQEEGDDVVWYPSNWQPMKSNIVVGVPLDLAGEEARRVIDLFYAWPDPYPRYTPNEMTITRILRIQNIPLWAKYYRKREQMERERKGESVKELLLFHGTATSRVDSICRKGWEIGRSSARPSMGRGIYFTPDSRLSHRYTACCSHNMPQIFASPLVSAVREDTRSFDDIDYSQGWQEAHPLIQSSEFSRSLGESFTLDNADLSSMEKGGAGSEEQSRTSNSALKRYLASFLKPRTVRPTRSTATGASNILQLAGSRNSTPSEVRVNIPAIDGSQDQNGGACKHYMFASSVLIGQSALGDSKYDMPPRIDERDPESGRFDSCYGYSSSFRQFVVYKSEQAYPEYLIEFTHKPYPRGFSAAISEENLAIDSVTGSKMWCILFSVLCVAIMVVFLLIACAPFIFIPRRP